jgi:hypothetical protein
VDEFPGFLEIKMSSDTEFEACGRFLACIRERSAYPRIRSRIRAIYGQIMTLGVILILVGVLAIAMLATAEGQRAPGLPVIVSVISIFAGWGVIEFAKYVRERMSMQVDMADSLLRIGSRPTDLAPATVVIPAEAEQQRMATVAGSRAAVEAPSPDSSPVPSLSAAQRTATDRDAEGAARYLLIRAKERIAAGQRIEAIDLMRQIVARYPETTSGLRAAEQLRKHRLA